MRVKIFSQINTPYVPDALTVLEKNINDFFLKNDIKIFDIKQSESVGVGSIDNDQIDCTTIITISIFYTENI
jgi:hypothetical protein